jgi:hypothetical protein
MGSTAQDVTGIVMALITVAFAALLVGHAGGTTQIIKGAGGTLNDLLNTVELSGNSGSTFNLAATPGV